MSSAYKWLPVVTQDCCTGCAKCVDACDHGCLELVWSYATLQRPADCGSEGTCMEACPEDAIRMAWVAAAGTHDLGRWQFVENEPAPVERPVGWLRRMISVWS